VSVAKTIRSAWSTAGYDAIVRHILGARYSLSVLLCGDRTAARLNREHRGKDTAANVLTFPLTETSGEILLNIAKVRREASKFGLSPQGHAKFLLIHGCLHLKGYTHGSTMELAEERLAKKFDLR
jgi:rRNA maturation RNase YbeY